VNSESDDTGSYSYSFISKHAAILVLLGVISLGLSASPANASQPNLNYTSIAAVPGGGFWIQRDGEHDGLDTRTIAIQGAPQFEHVGVAGSIASPPRYRGFWVVGVDGSIHARGVGIPELCGGHLRNCSGYGNLRIAAAAASPNADGLWAVDNEGHVWTAGNTVSYGDVAHDSVVPTGIAATPSGKGYYIVMADGGVHTRGDAVFYGSTGGNPPGGNSITGIALSYDITGDVNGYWLVASDGSVLTFGDAPFLGSTGGNGDAISGIVALPDGRSYAWVYSDGRVERSQGPPPVTLESIAWQTMIGVPNGDTQPGTPLLMESAHGGAGQKWNVVPVDVIGIGERVQIISAESGLCMDLEGGYPNGRILQYTCKTVEQHWGNQIWEPMKDQNGVIQLIPGLHPDRTLFGYRPEYGGGVTLTYKDNTLAGWTITNAM